MCVCVCEHIVHVCEYHSVLGKCLLPGLGEIFVRGNLCIIMVHVYIKITCMSIIIIAIIVCSDELAVSRERLIAKEEETKGTGTEMLYVIVAKLLLIGNQIMHLSSEEHTPLKLKLKGTHHIAGTLGKVVIIW